jgi:acyl transferase domain-containing protein
MSIASTEAMLGAIHDRLGVVLASVDNAPRLKIRNQSAESPDLKADDVDQREDSLSTVEVLSRLCESLDHVIERLDRLGRPVRHVPVHSSPHSSVADTPEGTASAGAPSGNPTDPFGGLV